MTDKNDLMLEYLDHMINKSALIVLNGKDIDNESRETFRQQINRLVAWKFKIRFPNEVYIYK